MTLAWQYRSRDTPSYILQLQQRSSYWHSRIQGPALVDLTTTTTTTLINRVTSDTHLTVQIQGHAFVDLTTTTTAEQLLTLTDPETRSRWSYNNNDDTYQQSNQWHSLDSTDPGTRTTFINRAISDIHLTVQIQGHAFVDLTTPPTTTTTTLINRADNDTHLAIQIKEHADLTITTKTPIDRINTQGSYSALKMMMMMSWCLMSSDVIWHIRDKLWPMPKHGSIKSTYVRCMRV